MYLGSRWKAGDDSQLAVESLGSVLTVSPDESVWDSCGGRGAGLGLTEARIPGRAGTDQLGVGGRQPSSGGHGPKPNIGTHSLKNTCRVGGDNEADLQCSRWLP